MSNDPLKRLLEQRANTWEQAKTHLDEVSADDSRSLTGENGEPTEDGVKWQRLNADLSEQDERINELRDLAERNAAAEETRERFGEAATPPTEERNTDEDVLRSLARGEKRAHTFRSERRDLTVGTATAGGNVVPTSFVSQLYEHMIEVSGIRLANPTVLQTDSGEDLQVPKTTSHSTASIITEGSTITESDPAFGQVTLGAYKYALLIQVSRELMEDSGVDLTGYLARQAGRAIGNASGAHFTTGSGSGQPRGVVTAASSGVTGATGNSGVPQYEELVDLKHSVIAPYRRNGAVFMMSDATLGEVRKLTDSNGQPLWQPSVTAGDPDMLLGHPVVVNPDVADAALSADSVVFGDFSAYTIRDVRAVSVERSDDFAFDADLATWRFIFRTDGDLVDESGAVKTFTGGAS